MIRHFLGRALMAVALIASAAPVLTVPQQAQARSDDPDAAERRANAKRIREAAEDGDVKAQLALGLMHATGGQGVRHSYKDAAKWFKAASAQGDAHATYYLGVLYSIGKGVDQDSDEALRLFRAAAAKNDPAAMVAIGDAYNDGDGVSEDAKQAYSWYKRAAEMNYPRGQTMVGWFMLTGRGGAPKDSKQAAGMVRAGAEQGDGMSMFVLAQLLSVGEGVSKDPRQAYMWALLASDRDVDKADTLISQLDRQLSAADKDAARQQAQGWRPKKAGQSADPYIGKGGKDDDGQGGGASDKSTKSGGSQGGQAAAQGQVVATGSGFFVSRQGHVVTNHHVIKGCSRLDLGNEAIGMMPAQVMGDDPGNDLALLKTGYEPKSVANFRSGPVRQAENVMAYGYPLTGLVSSGGNATSGNITALTGMRDDVRYYQMSAPVQPGNSGGPMVDASGNVVGVVVSKLDALGVAKVINDIPQNVNFAIKASLAANFLDSHSITYGSAALGDAKSPPDLSEQVKSFTVQVRCYN